MALAFGPATSGTEPATLLTIKTARVSALQLRADRVGRGHVGVGEEMALDIDQIVDVGADKSEAKAQMRFQHELDQATTARELHPWSFPEHDAQARAGMLLPVRIGAIAAGVAHTLMLDSSGTLWGIGRAEEGQLGCGGIVSGTISTAVALHALRGRRIASVAAGGWHSVAIDTAGVCFTWGDNRYGQCGSRMGESFVRLPAEFHRTAAAGQGALFAACGLRHTIVLRKRDRAAWVAGSNYFGQCATDESGEGGGEDDSSEDDDDGAVLAQRREGALSAQAADSAHTDAAAHNESGDTVVSYGGKGLGPVIPRFRINKRISPIEAAFVACGDSHSVFVSEMGNLWVCGRGDHGQLGLGSTRAEQTPQRVKTLSEEWAVHASAASTHTLVTTKSGKVFAAGTGTSGQLGLGPGVTRTTTFVQVPGLPACDSTAAGRLHSAATTSDTQQLYVWGEQSCFRVGIAKDPEKAACTFSDTNPGSSARAGIPVASESGMHRSMASFGAGAKLSGRKSAMGVVFSPVQSITIKLASDHKHATMFPFAPWREVDLPDASLSEADEVQAATKALAGLPRDVLDKLSDAEILELKRSFDQVDADGSGAIDAAELHSALLAVGELGVGHDDVNGIILRFDDSGDGELQFDEFVQLVMAVRRGDSSIGIGESLAMMLATGNEISAAASAKLKARLDALDPANIRLEARRVFRGLIAKPAEIHLPPHKGLSAVQLGEALQRMGITPPSKLSLETLAAELALQNSKIDSASFASGKVPERQEESAAGGGEPARHDSAAGGDLGSCAQVSEAQWLSYISAAHPVCTPSATATSKALARLRFAPPPRVDIVRSRRFVSAFRRLAERDNVELPTALEKRLADIAGQIGKSGAAAREGRIQLRSCGLRDTHISVLAEALRVAPVAKVLELNGNSITDAGVSVLVGLLDDQHLLAGSWQGAGGAKRVVERGTEFLEGFAEADEVADTGDTSTARLSPLEKRQLQRDAVVRSAGTATRQEALEAGKTVAEATELQTMAAKAAGEAFDTQYPVDEAKANGDGGGTKPRSVLEGVDVKQLLPAAFVHGLDDVDIDNDRGSRTGGHIPATAAASAKQSRFSDALADATCADTGRTTNQRSETDPPLSAQAPVYADDYAAALAYEQQNAHVGCIPWLRVNLRCPSPLVALGLRPREAVLPALRLDELFDGGPSYSDVEGRKGGQRGSHWEEDVVVQEAGRKLSRLDSETRPSSGHREAVTDVAALFRPGTAASRHSIVPVIAPVDMPRAQPPKSASLDDTVLGPIVCRVCGSSDTSSTANYAGRRGMFEQKHDEIFCRSCGCVWNLPVHFVWSVQVADVIKPERLLTIAKYNLQTGSRKRLRQFLESRTFFVQALQLRRAGLPPRPEEPRAGWGLQLAEFLDEYKVVIESHVQEYDKALQSLRATPVSAATSAAAYSPLLADLRKYARSLFAMHRRDYFDWTRAVMRQRAGRCVNRMLREAKAAYSQFSLPQEWEAFVKHLHKLHAATWQSILDGVAKWTLQVGDKVAVQRAVEAVEAKLVAYFDQLIRHVRVTNVLAGESGLSLLTADGEVWLFGGERSVDVSEPRIVWISKLRENKRISSTQTVVLTPELVSGMYSCSLHPDARGTAILSPDAAGATAVWDAVAPPLDATFAALTLSYPGPPRSRSTAQAPTIEVRLGDREGPLLACLQLRRATMDHSAVLTDETGRSLAVDPLSDAACDRHSIAKGERCGPKSCGVETLTTPIDAPVLRHWTTRQAVVLVMTTGSETVQIHRAELC